MYMRRIVLWFDHRYRSFPCYLFSGTIFENVTEHKMCALICSTIVSEKFILFGRIDLNTIKKTFIGLHVKYPLFLSEFNETLFSGHIFEKF